MEYFAYAVQYKSDMWSIRMHGWWAAYVIKLLESPVAGKWRQSSSPLPLPCMAEDEPLHMIWVGHGIVLSPSAR
jgi:hypothetical protein